MIKKKGICALILQYKHCYLQLKFKFKPKKKKKPFSFTNSIQIE